MVKFLLALALIACVVLIGLSIVRPDLVVKWRKTVVAALVGIAGSIMAFADTILQSL